MERRKDTRNTGKIEIECRIANEMPLFRKGSK
jgi:hypothetical protein